MAIRPTAPLIALLLLLYATDVQLPMCAAQSGLPSHRTASNRNQSGRPGLQPPRRLPPLPKQTIWGVNQASLQVPTEVRHVPLNLAAQLQGRLLTLPEPPPSQLPRTSWLTPAPQLSPESVDVPPLRPLSQNNQAPAAWWVLELEDYRLQANGLPVGTDQLFVWTVEYSYRLRATTAATNIARARIVQAEGAFDPVYFAEHQYLQTNDPVESTLATGGPPRLSDNILGLDAGVRGQSTNGLAYSAGQRIGLKDSNSNFFSPANQATSRIRAGISKPLLRGRVTDANRTLLVTARCESKAAEAELVQVLQDQLVEVGDAYWSLYFEHASRLQRIRHLQRAQQVLEILRARRDYDANQSQIYRAESALRLREAELVKLEARIGNLESRLQQLVNAPELQGRTSGTLLPVDPPLVYELEIDVPLIINTAMERSPEVARLSSQLAATAARLRLAADQTKPQVNLNLEGYIAGLQGNNQILDSWINQFDAGPGFTASLNLERPTNNRYARGALQQYRYEMIQLKNLIGEAREKARTGAETAIRNFQASLVAARSRQASLAAAEIELENLQDRWETLGDDPRLGQIQLSELLQAQDRVLQEEQSLLSAMIEFQVAKLALQRWDGSLIQVLAADQLEHE